MKSVLGITFTLASISWATPLSITGSGYSGGLHINGDRGFVFDWTFPDFADYFYQCDSPLSRVCVLSGPAASQQIQAGDSFFVSDGTTTIDGYAFPPSGFVAAHVVWIAEPIHFTVVMLPEQLGSITVPITVFGALKAWTTAEGYASNSAPFFDYGIRGKGSVRIGNTMVSYNGSEPISISWSGVGFNGDVFNFTGTADAVPEPASWLLALPILGVFVYRFARQRTYRASTS